MAMMRGFIFCLVCGAAAVACGQDTTHDSPSGDAPVQPNSILVEITLQGGPAEVGRIPLQCYRLDNPTRMFGAYEGQTDEHGRFRFEGLPGGLYRVEINAVPARGMFKPGERLNHLADYHLPVHLGDTQLINGQQTSVRFVAPRGAVIKGNVLDSAGRPAAGALVTSKHVCTGSSLVKTDDQGAFVLRGAHPDRDLKAAVQPQGLRYRQYFKTAANQLNVSAPAQINIVLPKATGEPNVIMTATDSLGAPIKMAAFWMRRTDGMIEGRLSVRGGQGSVELPPGVYNLTNRSSSGKESVSLELYEKQVTVTPGQVTELQAQLTYRPGWKPKPPTTTGDSN